jgi:ornithine cyclodeaminase
LLYGNIKQVYLYDRNDININKIDTGIKSKVIVANNWNEAYEDADIFITCTVSSAPYIDKKPKNGSLHLNVSLRDYKTDVFEWFKDSIIVDDWDEVCRENTDVEMMNKMNDLQKENTRSIVEIVQNNILENYDLMTPIMFNPMGMAVFDIAIGAYYRMKHIRK